eukprot:CAMPEP_0119039994 /NCGR_PEP_ID=MMETSP1177-20130426/9779_1 /TAXON_ID=2985 /ORGANISM="Ochromonas sp, Strain CCMP1899" /LENGTH=464 /DNA_ID=CAMNT_0007004597 /DNA_START=243 /DNA_END=1634 /DNA_ORIENTATION=+
MSAGLMDMFKGPTSKSVWSPEDFQKKISSVKSSGSIDTVPDWNSLEILLKELEHPQERTNYDLVLSGRGGANHKANIRLFDAPEGTVPDVTLYRDTAGWCPYCEKVWLQLEEKRIPYKVEKVAMRCYGDKPRSFIQINPGGGIPVAIVKGKTICESNDIMQELEDKYPNHNPLLPGKSSPQSARVAPLLKLERQAFSHWFSWLTSRSGASAAVEMDKILINVDRELGVAAGPYFLGTEMSLVDVMFTPFLERMAASLPYYKGFIVRDKKYPNLLRWFEAMDERSSYQGIKSDYYSHCQDLPPQIGGCQFLAESEPFKKEIDGGSWNIYKEPTACLEPMIPLDVGVARRDAVRQCIKNHAALVGFSLRGVGDKGQQVSAPLSNPYAKGDEQYRDVADFALRKIVHTMLLGSADDERDNQALTKEMITLLPKNEVKKCLLYLRERIGVPRDMTVHGARQFRGHINW